MEWKCLASRTNASTRRSRPACTAASLASPSEAELFSAELAVEEEEREPARRCCRARESVLTRSHTWWVSTWWVSECGGCQHGG
jgi:hypothetical protein